MWKWEGESGERRGDEKEAVGEWSPSLYDRHKSKADQLSTSGISVKIGGKTVIGGYKKRGAWTPNVALRKKKRAYFNLVLVLLVFVLCAQKLGAPYFPFCPSI